MALQIIDHGTPEYKEMVELRYNILRKPLGLTFTEEDLAKEKNDILIGCFDDDTLEACCILTPTGPKEVRLRQMAVFSGLQGKGMGRALMQFAENVAYDLGYRKISMHARITATGFYEKLGYNVVGDEFLEVTIPHYNMEKEL